MNFEDLGRALTIGNGQLTISLGTLTKNVDDFIIENFHAQSIVITDAQINPVIGSTDSIVVVGKSSFMNVNPTPSVEATFSLNEEGSVIVVLQYALISDVPDNTSWKFSRSFQNLPTVFNLQSTFTTPQESPLDSLYLFDSSLVVTTHPHQDPTSSALLEQGINFVSKIRPTGVFGIIENSLSGTDHLLMYGTIRIPEPTDSYLPLKAFESPWDQKKVPGINLKAALGINLELGKMRFNNVFFRIYSPPSMDWMEANPTYQPQQSYTGSLQVPSADIDADITAFMRWGDTEVLLSSQFSGVSVGKLAHLLDISGTDQLISNMPDKFREVGDNLGKLELTHAAISVGLSPNAGLVISGTYFNIGLPGMKWQVWDDHFEIDSLSCRFSVDDPFGKQPAVSVMLAGLVDIEGVPVAIEAGSQDGFSIQARLAEGQTIPLDQLMESYVPSVPAPSALTIDNAGVTIAPFRYYAMSMALASKPNPWEIDVGFEKLTVSDIGFYFLYPKGGPVSGWFSGSISFGDAAMLSMRYEIPSNFAVRGIFPEIKLSQLLSKLTNQSYVQPSGFDLTFKDSSVLIQKSGENYTFQFATELEGFGIFALEVRKISSVQNQWGFAAALNLTLGNPVNLPSLGPISMFLDLFHLDKLLLVVSSFDDTGFVLPDLSSFQDPTIGGGQIALPSGKGVMAGFNLFAQWTINTQDQKQKLLKELLGLNPMLSIVLQIGKNPSQDSKLYVRYDTKIDGMPFSCTFGGQIMGGSVALFLEGNLEVTIQGQTQLFDLILSFVPNGAFISTTMKGTTPVVISFEGYEVFKIGNLALLVGVDWEGIPSLGVAGSISEAGFESSIAVFFDSAEPSHSMVAGSLSDLTLRDILDTLTGNVLPSEIDNVLDQVGIKGTHSFEIPASLSKDLDDMQIAAVSAAFGAKGFDFPTSIQQVFWVVDTPGTRWFLTDQAHNMRHYQLVKKNDIIQVSLEAQLYCVPQRTTIGALTPFDPDFYINGAIHFFGFNASATVDINPDRGIAVDAQMDEIVIGTKSLFRISAARGDGGPRISVSTFDQPNHPDENLRKSHFYINGQVTVLGLSREIYASLTTSGMEFEFKGQMIPAVYLEAHGKVGGLADLGFGGKVQVGIGTVDLGILGKIDINTGVAGAVDISVNGSDIKASLDGSFQFAGRSFDVSLKLKTDTDALANIVQSLIDEVIDALKRLLSDPVKWAQYVEESLIQGISDVASVLEDVFGKTAEEAKQIIQEAKSLAEEVAKHCAMTQAVSSL